MKKFTLIILVLVGINANSQNVMSLYNMRHIPQVVYANPAFIPLGRINVSVPYVGSVGGHVGKSDFKLDIQFTQTNGETRLNTEKFLSGLTDENLIYSDFSIEALYVGFTIGNNYFFLSSNDKIRANLEFPKEMALLITEVYQDYGINDPLDIDNMRVGYTHYREYGLGWSRKINDKISLGARFKLLSGIISANSSTSGVFKGVSADSISGLVDVTIETSGVENYTDEILRINNVEDFIRSPYFGISGYNNYGYAIDLGFDYKINQKIKVSASVLDLFGNIEWTDHVKNYVADSVQVDFKTTDFDAIFTGDSESGLTNFLDSIAQNTAPTEAQRGFTTTIPTKVLGSFTYYITPKLEATILGQGEFTSNKFTPRLRVGIQGRFKRFVNYMVSYSIIDERAHIKNLGVGLALNLGPVQVYGLIDDVFDPFLFKSSFNPSIRFGLNLTFNRDYE